MCGIICIIQDIISSLFDLKPSFSGHHTHYIRHHVHCICVITPTLPMISQPLLCMISHPVYVRHSVYYIYDIIPTMYENNPVCWLHHTLHMYDIICATEDVTSTLTHQATIFMISHPIQAYHHSPCIRNDTNSVFVITTSPLKSHPLLYDITPTICVTSYALCMTSYPLLMSSHYFTYDSTTLTYETTSSMQFKICTIHVTSQSLVCVITRTVLRASHPLFVWHHTRHRHSTFCTIEDITSSLYEIKPPFLWHQTHYILHCIDAISITTSNVLMITHQQYLWDVILYICQHHIHCIQQHIPYIFSIRATVPVSHTHSFHDITPFVYMTLHPLYV